MGKRGGGGEMETDATAVNPHVDLKYADIREEDHDSLVPTVVRDLLVPLARRSGADPKALDRLLAGGNVAWCHFSAVKAPDETVERTSLACVRNEFVKRYGSYTKKKKKNGGEGIRAFGLFCVARDHRYGTRVWLLGFARPEDVTRRGIRVKGDLMLHGHGIGSSGGLLVRCADFDLDVERFDKSTLDDGGVPTAPSDPASNVPPIYVFRWDVREFGGDDFGSLEWDGVEDAVVNRLWFLVMEGWDGREGLTLDARDPGAQSRCVHVLILISFAIDKLDWYVGREADMLGHRLGSMTESALFDLCRTEGVPPGNSASEAIRSEQVRRMGLVGEALKGDADGFREILSNVLLKDSNVIKRCYGVFAEHRNWLAESERKTK